MSTVVAIVEFALLHLSEGGVLAAVVYLVNRGIRHPLHKRRK